MLYKKSRRRRGRYRMVVLDTTLCCIRNLGVASRRRRGRYRMVVLDTTLCCIRSL